MTQYEVKQIEKYRKDIKLNSIVEVITALLGAISAICIIGLTIYNFNSPEMVEKLPIYASLCSSTYGMAKAQKMIKEAIINKADLKDKIKELENKDENPFDIYQGKSK